MKNFFGYIRVSTAKQGEQGVSLQEQRDAIARHAQHNGLEITAWFEERETAAKRGRPVFSQMLKLLGQGQVAGVIIHKIDRSARNLKDWADLGELIDQGIEVHFANESLDLHSRGGRLSADIQAVVASDYIRNLREETRKGFYGRLKQGIYPLPAPLGYLDRGKGNPKTLDPSRAPLVRRAFELYATGRFGLDTLGEELLRLGLRNRRGGRLTRTGLSILLNNPFYIGLIRLKRTGETFPGAHESLISKTLFDRVQLVLRGKTYARPLGHDFLFRRLLACKGCRYSLIGERQKGHVYYRCHSKTCRGTSVREEEVDRIVRETLAALQLRPEEKAYFERRVMRLRENWKDEKESQIKALELRGRQMEDRLTRLTDAYIDQVIERELFEQRKTALLMERKNLEENMAALSRDGGSVADQLMEFLELAGSAYNRYDLGFMEEKRDLVRIVTSNRVVQGKSVALMLLEPFQVLANRPKTSYGAPYRDRPRTFGKLMGDLLKWFEDSPPTLFRGVSNNYAHDSSQ